jgi:hypothetical protein
MKLLWRFRRRDGSKAAVDPGSPHRFRQLNDPGIGAAISGSSVSQTGAGVALNVAATGNFVREQRCGVPGCNRTPDDPIHFPEG